MERTISRCQYCGHGMWSDAECTNEFCSGEDLITQIRRERGGTIASVSLEDDVKTVPKRVVPSIDYEHEVNSNEVMTSIFNRIKSDFSYVDKAYKVAYLIGKGYSGRYMKGESLYGSLKTVQLQKEFGILR